MTATQLRLHAFHKNWYDEALSDALAHPTMHSPVIQRYQDRFSACLPAEPLLSTWTAMMAAIQRSEVLLFGDFHTLGPSQHAFINIITAQLENINNRPLCLALEMFKARDQLVIDRFLQHQLSEEALLRMVRYDKEWGFPWAHYREILLFARQHGVDVLCINTNRGGKDELQQRDKFAADLITAYQSRHQGCLISCLIGEYHLADEALPRLLCRNGLEVLRIFSNIDRYNLNLGLSYESSGQEVLELNPQMYCLLNAAPWLKWQSYALWEEQRQVDHSRRVEASADAYNEERFDVDHHIVRLATKLSDYLGLQLNPTELSRFHAIVLSEAELIVELRQGHNLATAQQKALLYRSQTEGFCMLPNGPSILFTDPSLPALAEAAGQLLCHLLREEQSGHIIVQQDFWRRVESFAAGALAAKILDPKHRSRDLSTFHHLLLPEPQDLATPSRIELDEVQTLLCFCSWIDSNDSSAPLPKELIDEDLRLDYGLSLALGQVLGSALFSQQIVLNHDTEPHAALFQASLPVGTLLRQALYAKKALA